MNGDAVGARRDAPLLDDLYQEVILDHNRSPRNFGPLPDATATAHGINPLCGDHFDVHIKDQNGILGSVHFEGEGCAISKASASLMTAAIEGKSLQQAMALTSSFIHVLTDGTVAAADREAIGKLKFFEGVKNFPIRVKCATLPWRALEEAIKGNDQEVSTE